MVSVIRERPCCSRWGRRQIAVGMGALAMAHRIADGTGGLACCMAANAVAVAEAVGPQRLALRGKVSLPLLPQRHP